MLLIVQVGVITCKAKEPDVPPRAPLGQLQGHQLGTTAHWSFAHFNPRRPPGGREMEGKSPYHLLQLPHIIDLLPNSCLSSSARSFLSLLPLQGPWLSFAALSWLFPHPGAAVMSHADKAATAYLHEIDGGGPASLLALSSQVCKFGLLALLGVLDSLLPWDGKLYEQCRLGHNGAQHDVWLE